MGFSAGNLKFDLSYTQNHSPFLDQIHREYAFTRASPASGIPALRHGFSLACSVQLPLKEQKFFYGGSLLFSRFSSSDSDPAQIDLNAYRFNLSPFFGIPFLVKQETSFDFSFGPIAGLHVFSLNKYGDPLQLEDDKNYRPAFFNWGIHLCVTITRQFADLAAYTFFRNEVYPNYRIGNYQSALLGTSYPWLTPNGLTLSFSAGLGLKF
jgi:hypothetical protein